MAFQIGKIDCFDGNVETWNCYKERLDQYFLANEVADNKQVAALLALIGSTTYRLLRDICSPDLPSTKTYVELCEILKKHFSPKPIVIAERFRFHKRDQQMDESVKDFNVSLRKLSEFCDFGTNLKDALRDRFVCGLRNEGIQKKLLSIADLTYEKSLEIALAMESASKDVVELQAKKFQPVNKLKVKKFKPKKVFQAHKEPPKQFQAAKENTPCYHCSRSNHDPNKCKFKTATCYKCSKVGHIVPACKPQFLTKQQKVHNLEAEQSYSGTESDSSSQEYLFSLTDSKRGKRDSIFIEPNINGTTLQMELDTGAGVSVISSKDYENYFVDSELQETNLKLKTYSGEEIQPIGVMNCTVTLDGQTKQLNLYVIGNDSSKPLFGREWLHELQLDWVAIKSLKGQSISEAEQLKSKYKDIFSPGLGKLKDMLLNLKLIKNLTSWLNLVF